MSLSHSKVLKIAFKDISGVARYRNNILDTSINGTIEGVIEGYMEFRISNDFEYFSNTMKSVVTHEFFHNAQFDSYYKKKLRKEKEFPELLTRNRDWIIEGQAKWFEDYANDEFNTYTIFGGSPKILSRGLTGINKESKRTGVYSPYERFTFHKLLERACDTIEDMKLKLNKTPII